MTRLTSRKWVRRLFHYRREFDIYAVVAAMIHPIIVLISWDELDLWRLFGLTAGSSMPHPSAGKTLRYCQSNPA